MALYVANKYRCTTAPLLDTPRRIGEESVRTRLVTPVVNKVIRDIYKFQHPVNVCDGVGQSVFVGE